MFVKNNFKLVLQTLELIINMQHVRRLDNSYD